MSFSDTPYRTLARWVTGDREAWIALGRAETRLFARRRPPVVSPVYVTGLARAGTTILTEALARHPDIATHRYRDFPCLFTPYLWNRLLISFDWIPHRERPRERAHKDGMLVTPKSPEAMEEMLWMAFFPHLHDEARSAVLGPETQNPAFARFYRQHIEKLLKVRRRTRYAAKANYNLTRIAYLTRLFADARFVIVVRHPLAQVASLSRMHKLFTAERKQNPAALTHMDQVGHFEFGQHRTLIHTGDAAAMAQVKAAFAASEDIRGWARYWAMLHRFIRESCEGKTGVLVVRHEDLSAHPEETLKSIFAHCGLAMNDTIVNASAMPLHATEGGILSDEEKAIINEETAAIAMHWGYTP